MHEYATLGPYEEMVIPKNQFTLTILSCFFFPQQPAAPLAIYETSAGSAVYANIFEQVSTPHER